MARGALLLAPVPDKPPLAPVPDEPPLAPEPDEPPVPVEMDGSLSDGECAR